MFFLTNLFSYKMQNLIPETAAELQNRRIPSYFQILSW